MMKFEHALKLTTWNLTVKLPISTVNTDDMCDLVLNGMIWYDSVLFGMVWHDFAVRN